MSIILDASSHQEVPHVSLLICWLAPASIVDAQPNLPVVSNRYTLDHFFLSCPLGQTEHNL